MDDILKLYNNPLPANRSGALYNAFPYPTKISPEAVALYIACHTKIGDCNGWRYALAGLEVLNFRININDE